MFKGAVVAQFKLLLRHFHVCTEKGQYMNAGPVEYEAK